jgi:hypothetical protein
MKTKTPIKAEVRNLVNRSTGMKVHSSIKAGLDGSSKDAAYCRPNSGASLNHNESMKVRSGVKAGLKTRH